MKMPERDRFIGDEDVLEIWWYRNGTLIDFSTGYTFEATVAAESDLTDILFTKTSGFTAAAGTGTEVTGTPNLSVAWQTVGELNSLTAAGKYRLQVKATKTDSSETTYHMRLNMLSRLG